MPSPLPSLSWGRASLARARQQVVVNAMDAPCIKRETISAEIEYERAKPVKAMPRTLIEPINMYLRLKESIAGAETSLKTSAVTAKILETVPITSGVPPRNLAYLEMRVFDMYCPIFNAILTSKRLTKVLLNMRLFLFDIGSFALYGHLSLK